MIRLRTLLPLVALATVSCGSASNEGTGLPAQVGEPDVVVPIVAFDYGFRGDPATQIQAGDVVRFEVSNEGAVDHELRVLDENSIELDGTGRIVPGGSGSVVVEFESAGTYRVICDIDDHLSRGQRAVFEVTEPSE